VLRHALAQSGADYALVKLLDEDAIVYAGYSAGPCVLSPNLKGFELVDELKTFKKYTVSLRLGLGLDVLGLLIRTPLCFARSPRDRRHRRGCRVL
jgi:hypothetical protein